MEATVLEWLNLVLRWAHVIAAIMWIGDSFLFMWMDSHLEKPAKPREGDVMGELWMAHGGGFYELVKRKSLRPSEIPERLYSFKWESYSTWITGFFLITVVYYFGGQAMLAQPGGPLQHAESVSLSILLLGGAVLLYQLLCATPLLDSPRVLGVLMLGVLMAVTWGLSFVFTERATFLQVGAMIATVMSSNVLLRIIPAQRHMMAATRAGTPVDTSYGLRAKKHSTHNHYVTLPVLFLMLSNHFPSVYAAPRPWLMVALITVVGVGVKVFMNRRFSMPPVQLGGTAAALGVVIFLTLPAAATVDPSLAEGPKVAFGTVHQIVEMRCNSCHAKRPSDPAFPAPPNGIVLETPEQIAGLKDRILARVVTTRTMPLGNITGMTEEERATIAAWIAQGADIQSSSSAVVNAAAPPKPAKAPAPPKHEDAPADAGIALAMAAPAASPAKSPQEEAAALYKLRCMVCHGPTGDGDGAAAASLRPAPRRFADAAWQAGITDEEIRKVIVGGGPALGKSALMPANPDLGNNGEVLKELVKLIRGFKD